MKQKFINYLLALLSIVAIVFSIIRIFPFSVDGDTYVGTLISLLAIIVAIIIGYQIINVIEIRRELSDARKANYNILMKSKELERKIRKNNHDLEQSINTKIAILENITKEQEYCMQEGFDIMSALVEYNSGQNFTTCAIAFASMHKALLSSIKTNRTDYEWIFYWLRKYISLMQMQSFYVSVDKRKEENTHSPYPEKRISEILDDYSKPIYDVDAEIRKDKNYIKIKMEYERVMRHFKKRLNDILANPIKVPSQDEVDEIMNT